MLCLRPNLQLEKPLVAVFHTIVMVLNHELHGNYLPDYLPYLNEQRPVL